MAGPSSDASRRHAHRFAQDFLEAAEGAVRHERSVPFGSTVLRLGISRLDDVGSLIDGAFPASPETSHRYSLAVVRHGDLGPFASLHWAQPWIERREILPAAMTYPYRIHIDNVTGQLSVLDQRLGRAAVWVRRDCEVDARSLLTPFRVLLSWLARLHEAEVVHASAAVVDGHGLVFSGPSGSGKSTLALALGRAGHRIIADDLVLLEQDVIHAVYRRAKIDAQAQVLLGVGDGALDPAVTHNAKKTLDLEGWGSTWCRAAPMSAWVLPTLSTTVGWYEMDRRWAFHSIAASSLREVFGGTTGNTLRLARLVSAHPTFRLLLSSDVEDNVAAVCDLVEHLRLRFPERERGDVNA